MRQSKDVRCNAQQTEAVLHVWSKPVACLKRRGGTGKTYTCKVLCDVWERLGGEVLPCALAGRAILRLPRSTRRLAKTLARTIGGLKQRDRLDLIVDPPERDEDARASVVRKRDTLAKIDASTLVLIDEASLGRDVPAPSRTGRHVSEPNALLSEDNVAGIADVPLRHQVNLVLAQNRSLKAQLDILKRVGNAHVVRIASGQQSYNLDEPPPLANHLARSDTEVEAFQNFLDLRQTEGMSPFTRR